MNINMLNEESMNQHSVMIREAQEQQLVNPSINYDPSASLAESIPFGRDTMVDYEEDSGYLDQQQSSTTGGA